MQMPANRKDEWLRAFGEQSPTNRARGHSVVAYDTPSSALTHRVQRVCAGCWTVTGGRGSRRVDTRSAYSST